MIELFYVSRFFAPQNRLVTLKLIRYSLWMILIPLITFYFFQLIIFKGDNSMISYSGFLAVFSVNVVIFAYIRMAISEDKDEKQDLFKNVMKTD